MVDKKQDNKLTPEQYKAIAEVVIKIHEEQKNKALRQEADARTNDVRLLLKNYRRFKIYCRNAVTDVKKAKATLAALLNDLGSLDDELKVEAIVRTKERTLVMVAHIEKMLQIYKQMCHQEASEVDIRRWNIIYDFYINPTKKPTAEELAEKYNVDRSTVFSDISRACEEIGPLLFGVSGIK